MTWLSKYAYELSTRQITYLLTQLMTFEDKPMFEKIC